MGVETRRTTCSRDCPDACGIVATVESADSGAERIVRIEGDRDHPVTSGFLCFRTSKFVERQRRPDRLTAPLLRRGRDLQPVSWGEALAEIEQRFRRILDESGPSAIFHYRSGGSLGLLKTLADRFFEELGPCTTKIGDICSGAGEWAQEQDFGVSESSDLGLLRESRQILLWGKNPTVSNVHLVPVLKEARRRGARIWLIDPIAHKTAALVDRVVSPRPGGDLDLALGVAAALFAADGLDPEAASRCDNLEGFRALAMARTVEEHAQEAGVEAAVCRELADALMDGPAAIQVGWGMQRRQHGAAIVRALDALSAISGNLYRRGGGCSFYFGRRTAFRSFARGLEPPRVIREPLFGRDVLDATDPPIRCIWVTAGNPVSMLPDAANVALALDRTEFVVVVDPFLTDTARRADLALPVPTLLEDDDVLGAYGHHYLSESRPVVAPPAEVWPEHRIFQELAQRMGLDGVPQGSTDDLKRELLADVAERGVTLEALREGPQRNPLAQEVLFEGGRVRTPNGKVQLMVSRPETAIEEPVHRPGASAPLWLFSNSTAQAQGSIWSGRGLGARVWVRVHPDAVVVEGGEPLREGDDVVVESPTGSLLARLEFDEALRPDVALMPKGGSFDLGHAANALIEARPTDEGLGAAYLDCKVRLRREG